MFTSQSGCSLALLLVLATAAALLLNAESTLAGSSSMDSVKPEMSEGSGKGGSAGTNFYANGSPRRRNSRSIYGFGPKMLQISRSKIPIELDLLVDNEDTDRSKRTFDDYGHMRFGKRGGEEQFDDYGHMRFGRRR